MRKITLAILAIVASLMQGFAQAPDTSGYALRKLKLEEINFVSGYYSQDGNNSGVTGGLGTEKLTDFANTLELKVAWKNMHKITNHLSLEFGIDTYTSASSDNINPYELSGPSHQDTRIYPSLSWNMENDSARTNLGAGLSFSSEYDYKSTGINFNFAKTSKDKNREFNARLMAFFDQWKVIYPYELRPPGYGDGSHEDRYPVNTEPRNSYQGTFTLSQVINNRLQMSFILDPSYMEGQLTTLYQRVYYNDHSAHIEHLPDTRMKFAAGLRANYFLADRFVLRTFYRFYTDDWGNTAHTANLEVPVKLSPYFTLIPFYRFDTQTGIKYFAPIYVHTAADTYYTSDYDLAPFDAHFIGMGFRIMPLHGIFGSEYFNSLELRYGHYIRNTGTGLAADIVTLALKFK
jgi:hypothetical protein